MTHGFTRITGIAVAVLLIGSGPAWAGAYKHRRAGAEADGSPAQGPTSPGSPSVGGALDTDTSVDRQVEPSVKPPDEPSASPRMETQPGARNRRTPDPDRPAPRSDEHLNRPDAQSPRPDGSQPQGDMRSPWPEPTPGQPDEQPLRSYKQ
jgi:hypothetical protein